MLPAMRHLEMVAIMNRMEKHTAGIYSHRDALHVILFY